MADGAVVFNKDGGYDFYIVRRNLKDEYDIDRIQMPRVGTSLRELTDELVIGIPSSERCGGQDKKLIAAYEALRGRK